MSTRPKMAFQASSLPPGERKTAPLAQESEGSRGFDKVPVFAPAVTLLNSCSGY